jgi:translation initiation factor IF-3
MDLCVLELTATAPRYTRITRIMDYGRWKYGNPVVSPNGRMIAAQVGSADVIDAGVGQGIVIIDLPQGY